MSCSQMNSPVRDRILDASDRLLARFGYRKMTVDDIAAEAGIGKGSVYLHFRSKEEVALSCLDRMIEALIVRLDALAAEDRPAPERLRDMLFARVLHRFDYARRHRHSIDEKLAAMRSGLLARRAEHFRREAAVFARVLDSGGGRGEIRALDAADTAHSLILATNALLPYSLSVRELGLRADLARRAEALIDLVIAGLAKPLPHRSHHNSRRLDMSRRTLLAWMAPLALLAPQPASAQTMGRPDQPDLPVDARTRSAVVESLMVQVQRRYVFPDKGAEVARALRKRAAAKQYDGITSSKELADSLTAHVQAVSHDLHLRVHYRNDPFPVQNDREEPSRSELDRQITEERRRNFGFEKVQRLPGNVGYVDLRMFSDSPEAQPTAIAAMNFLANSDALIIDLRRNGGGSPSMIQTVLTYLTPAGERIHFNDFYDRQGDQTEQWYTASFVPGSRFAGKPIYVLTSPRTASAAEEFSYDVRTLELGTLIGETTAGGAHPGGLFRLSDHFAAFIATGRAINPVTKTNWEGVGVKPDVPVPAGEALREAHVAAVQKLLANAKDDDHRAMLERSLEAAKNTTPDPAEDFARPMRRRTTS